MRNDDTYAATIDPDARRYPKTRSKDPQPCFMGHARMESRHGLTVGAVAACASGHAERLAAPRPIEPYPCGPRRIRGDADRGFDTTDLIADMPEVNVAPDVA